MNPKSVNLRVQSWWMKFFFLFKGYLNTQLEAKGKLIEDQSNIERSASEFKFKGDREQFEVNATLESLLSRIKTNADRRPHSST